MITFRYIEFLPVCKFVHHFIHTHSYKLIVDREVEHVLVLWGFWHFYIFLCLIFGPRVFLFTFNCHVLSQDRKCIIAHFIHTFMQKINLNNHLFSFLIVYK